MGGISPAVTKEDLEADFRKFGKIEDYKFFRDRNTACVEFFNLDDATQAMKIMNGKRIGGENIRVDFLRSNATKKVSFTLKCWFCFLFFHFLILFSYLLYYYIHPDVLVVSIISTRLLGCSSLKMRHWNAISCIISNSYLSERPFCEAFHILKWTLVAFIARFV